MQGCMLTAVVHMHLAEASRKSGYFSKPPDPRWTGNSTIPDPTRPGNFTPLNEYPPRKQHRCHNRLVVVDSVFLGRRLLQ